MEALISSLINFSCSSLSRGRRSASRWENHEGTRGPPARQLQPHPAALLQGGDHHPAGAAGPQWLAVRPRRTLDKVSLHKSELSLFAIHLHCSPSSPPQTPRRTDTSVENPGVGFPHVGRAAPPDVSDMVLLTVYWGRQQWMEPFIWSRLRNYRDRGVLFFFRERENQSTASVRKMTSAERDRRSVLSP